jgi:hypothetical protein
MRIVLLWFSGMFLLVIMLGVGRVLFRRWLHQRPLFKRGQEAPAQKDWIVEIKWENSILLYLVRLVNNIFAFLSPVRRLWRLLRTIGIDWRPWWVEVWLFFLLGVLLICLFWGFPGDDLVWWIAFLILMDSVGATIRDIGGQLHKSGKIEIYNSVRWLLMALLNVLQVTFCFAAFTLYFGHQFDPPVIDGPTAIYFSTVTISTLGYGDIKPLSPEAKALVSWGLLAFLLFLAIKLPIAVAVIKVKEHPEKWP